MSLEHCIIMSSVLLEFQGGEICQGGEILSRGGRYFVRGGVAAPPSPPLNEALIPITEINRREVSSI